MRYFYGIGSTGLALPGMDDAGEMSSWFVFAALGLYPYTSADARYLVTVPLFDNVKWKTGSGKILTIQHMGNNRALKEIKVNDTTVNGYFISQDLFENGGDIQVITE